MKKSIFFAFISIFFFNLFSYDLEQDLDFMYHHLKENHPGYYDQQNPQFRANLEELYKNTKEKFKKILNNTEKRTIITDLLKQFHCAHLRVFYQKETEQNNMPKKFENLIWSFETIKENTYLITLPTFDPSLLDMESKSKTLKEIEKHARKEHVCFIFDLRGNGGGNSYLGQKVLSSLFGEEITKQAHIIDLMRDNDI